MVVSGRLPRETPSRSLAYRNTQIDGVSPPAGQNQADSEQAPQKTGRIPYRFANLLLNAVLPKGQRDEPFTNNWCLYAWAGRQRKVFGQAGLASFPEWVMHRRGYSGRVGGIPDARFHMGPIPGVT